MPAGSKSTSSRIPSASRTFTRPPTADLNLITFNPDESVQVEPVIMPPGCKAALLENLCLFYVGGSRPAGSILAEQQDNIHRDKRKADLVARMAELARQLRVSLVKRQHQRHGPVLG